jgi:two-component system chemotaxis response regulator CheY
MSNKKVLVVDDSATVRQEVAAVLSPLGFQVLQAEDGMVGAEVIQGHPDIALVICDVNMPRLNGIEMLSLVKSRPEHANLPILMLTSEGQPSLIKQAKALGAKGWIVKPFNPAHLAAAVQKLSSSP